jgi:hypothetical protein
VTPHIDVVASLAVVTEYRMSRRIALGNMAIFVVLWVMFVLQPTSISAVDLIVTGVFTVASVYAFHAVPAAALRGVRPLPLGLSEEEARKRSLDSLASATAFGGAFGLVVPYTSMIVAWLTKNPWTYAVPFVVVEVTLYLYVRPAPRTLSAIRQRLQADGATAYLEPRP